MTAEIPLGEDDPEIAAALAPIVAALDGLFDPGPPGIKLSQLTALLEAPGLALFDYEVEWEALLGDLPRSGQSETLGHAIADLLALLERDTPDLPDETEIRLAIRPT